MRRTVLVFCVFVLSAGPLRSVDSVSRETGAGLHTVRLSTPQGSINVHGPDDAAAGDTIVGTVWYEPHGDTEAQREQNLGTLRGYVVEVDDEPVESEQKTWTRTAAAAAAMVVRFRDRGGNAVGEAPIPTLARPPLPAPAPGSVEVASWAQAGHPTEIAGRISRQPSVTIGGEEAPLIAQSPRKTIVQVPSDAAGETTMRVEEDDRVAEAPIRVIPVQIAADKLYLKSGERTTLHVHVLGLTGLTTPVPLTLTNRSPHVVRVGRTNVEQITIRPRDVAPGGTFAVDRPIQSKLPGSFAVNASIGPAPRRGFPLVPLVTAAAPLLAAGDDEGCVCQCRVVFTRNGKELEGDQIKVTRDPAKNQVIKLEAKVRFFNCQPGDIETPEILVADYTWISEGNTKPKVNKDGTAEILVKAGESVSGSIALQASIDYRCRRKGKEWQPRKGQCSSAKISIVDADRKICACELSVSGRVINPSTNRITLKGKGKQSVTLAAEARLACVGCTTKVQQPFKYTWTYTGPGTLTGSGNTVTLTYDPTKDTGIAEGSVQVKADVTYACDNGPDQSADCSKRIIVIAPEQTGCLCREPKVEIRHEWTDVKWAEERTTTPVAKVTERKFVSAKVVLTANDTVGCDGGEACAQKPSTYKWTDNKKGTAFQDGARTLTIETKESILDVDVTVEVTPMCGTTKCKPVSKRYAKVIQIF